MSDQIHFEFPLNERIRLFLRLEQLFLQMQYFQAGSYSWDARSLIDTLLDILTILNRNDIKSEILKELDRHSVLLKKLSQNALVDNTALNELQKKITSTRTTLSSHKGKIGAETLQLDFFQSVALRSSISGGTCSFDLPWFHRWLEQPEQQRHADVAIWIEPLLPILQGINLILQMVRQSAPAEAQMADAGFFQASLDQARPFQLIRVSIQPDLPVYAEISGGKHRFTVRFMQSSAQQRPTQIDQEIKFELTRCLL